MFAFCVGELGLSEDVACNRIDLARAARRMPVILEALRSGRVHLAGLRLLAPHLTTENQETVLADAAGKSNRGAGRASLAAAAGSNCGAQASRPQPHTRSVTRILVRRRHAGGATRVAPCSRSGDRRRESTRRAHRAGEEGAIRHVSEGGTDSSREDRRLGFASHSRRCAVRTAKAPRTTCTVERRSDLTDARGGHSSLASAASSGSRRVSRRCADAASTPPYASAIASASPR
jgi:hypothetical protein